MPGVALQISQLGEVGQTTTGLAAILAVVAAVIGLGSTRRPGLRLARAATGGYLTAAAASVSILAWSLLNQDLGLEYVATHSRLSGGRLYRLAGLWAGAEGSLLTYSTMLASVGAYAVRRRTNRQVGVAALIAATHFVAVALFANPFALLDLPATSGQGLTPILEHPAMLWHPPVLYAGLALTLVPFLKGLNSGASTPPPLAELRWASGLLMAGLAGGANWAYVELGWGGYWGWDPVENTGLMPWLGCMVALHLGGGSRVRPVAAMTPFALTCFGVAVTRSGGLSSVHAFADSRALGWVLGALTLFVCAVTAWKAVGLMRRDPNTRRAGARERNVVNYPGSSFNSSRMSPIAVTLLTGAIVVIFSGVFWSLWLNDRVVTATYYNDAVAPIAILGLVGLAALGLVPNRRGSANGPAMRPRFGMRTGGLLTCTALASGITTANIANVTGWFSFAVVALVPVTVLSQLLLIARAPAGRRVPLASASLAHLAFASLLLAVAASAQGQAARRSLVPGDRIDLGEIALLYEGLNVGDGPRLGSEAVTATFELTETGSATSYLRPQLVSYPSHGIVLAEAAVSSTLRRDVQLVLHTSTADGIVSVHAVTRPLVRLLWFSAGGLVTASGLSVLITGRASTLSRKQLVNRRL